MNTPTDENDNTSRTEPYTNLNEIVKNGGGTIRLADGSETLHLTVTGIAETLFMRVFDTKLFGESPSGTERVIIQTRTDRTDEWSSPYVHFRSDDGLTGGHIAVLR